MTEVTADVVIPTQLVLPQVTGTVRDTMQASPGTIIYNAGSGVLNYCVASAASSGSWRAVGTTAI